MYLSFFFFMLIYLSFIFIKFLFNLNFLIIILKKILGVTTELGSNPLLIFFTQVVFIYIIFATLSKSFLLTKTTAICLLTPHQLNLCAQKFLKSLCLSDAQNLTTR